MKHNQNDNIFHIGELLGVFNDIDFRIRALHQNSSQVFLQLNEFLKDYYKKNSIISSNATQIFDTLAGNKDSCLTSEINSIFNDFEGYKIMTDDELDANLSVYSQLDNKINSLSVLIRNFKQDLLTLKFLITNYRIVKNNGNDARFSPESVEMLEKCTNDTHAWLTGIGIDLTNLGVRIEGLYKNIREYSQNSVNKTFSLCEELRSSLALINKKYLESKNYIPILRDKINSSSESIGNIITHLQYHDIIRQKIEHIQLFHFKIIDSLKEDIARSGETIIREDDKKVAIIADISGLQAAQLILISKEYQKALEVISDNFQKIADDLTTVTTISHEFSVDAENSEITLINLVKGRLDRTLLLLDEHNSSSFNQSLLIVKQKIFDIHNNANQRIIKPLENVVLPFITPDRTNKQKDIENKPNIVAQIASLICDIDHKRQDLQTELTSVLELSERFQVETDTNGFSSKLEKEQIRIMVSISKTLGRLDEESNQLDMVLLQNRNIKKDIIDRLKETLTKADYYELFEKVLNDIIEKLNSLNSRFKIDNNNIDRSEKTHNLKDIEAYYTVASERIIHNKVINEDDEISLSDNTNKDEDIELF